MNNRPKIIIDGYNMILRTRKHPFGDENENWQARQRLIDRLAAYQAQKNISIIIVFDGSDSAPPDHSHQSAGIKIHFAKIADSLIKDMVDQAAQPRNITVVTSDRDLAFAVRSQGAQTLAVESFERKLKNKNNPVKEYDAKYNVRMSKKELQNWLELFKGENNE